MQLHDDAWDNVLLRKADEAPGGMFPLNYVWTAPDYDPAKFSQADTLPPGSVAPAQVVITAQRPKPAPTPMAPIQIPILQFPKVPAFDPWAGIMQNRAAMVQRPPLSAASPGWQRYLPWIAAAIAAAVLLGMATGGDKKPQTKTTARRAPVRARRVAYARGRRR